VHEDYYLWQEFKNSNMIRENDDQESFKIELKINDFVFKAVILNKNSVVEGLKEIEDDVNLLVKSVIFFSNSIRIDYNLLDALKNL
jgi:hypothetical protein